MYLLNIIIYLNECGKLDGFRALGNARELNEIHSLALAETVNSRNIALSARHRELKKKWMGITRGTNEDFYVKTSNSVEKCEKG